MVLLATGPVVCYEGSGNRDEDEERKRRCWMFIPNGQYSFRYGKSSPNALVPGPDEGMKSTADVDLYMQYKEANLELLDSLVEAGGDFERSRKLMVEEGDLLVTNGHCETYLLLSCLEYEMAGDKKKM